MSLLLCWGSRLYVCMYVWLEPVISEDSNLNWFPWRYCLSHKVGCILQRLMWTHILVGVIAMILTSIGGYQSQFCYHNSLRQHSCFLDVISGVIMFPLDRTFVLECHVWCNCHDSLRQQLCCRILCHVLSSWFIEAAPVLVGDIPDVMIHWGSTSDRLCLVLSSWRMKTALVVIIMILWDCKSIVGCHFWYCRHDSFNGTALVWGFFFDVIHGVIHWYMYFTYYG